jgi:hypothetical protein
VSQLDYRRVDLVKAEVITLLPQRRNAAGPQSHDPDAQLSLGRVLGKSPRMEPGGNRNPCVASIIGRGPAAHFRVEKLVAVIDLAVSEHAHRSQVAIFFMHSQDAVEVAIHILGVPVVLIDVKPE